jgi:ABC-type antimicrobial peptide transport system permease subunit
MYMPFTQVGDFGTLDMVVRSKLPIHVLAKDVASAIHAIDPAMPTGEYQTLESLVERSVSPRRFTLQLLVAFAATALLLAALGIYGVLSYSVTERIPEIGIRMALGETGAGILRRVVGKTLVLAAIGLVLGTVGSFAASRWVASLLYSVEPADPWTFLIMATVLMLVAGLAGFIPALRASRTQAASVLRSSS